MNFTGKPDGGKSGRGDQEPFGDARRPCHTGVSPKSVLNLMVVYQKYYRIVSIGEESNYFLPGTTKVKPELYYLYTLTDLSFCQRE